MLAGSALSKLRHHTDGLWCGQLAQGGYLMVERLVVKPLTLLSLGLTW